MNSETENSVCFCTHLKEQHDSSTGCVVCNCKQFFPSFLQGAPPAISAATVLEEMAATYRERNTVYGDNYRMVGPIIAILFPQGAPPELLRSHQFHLFELKIVKLTRFAISNLTHLDSIHDDGVYSALIEAILRNKENV